MAEERIFVELMTNSEGTVSIAVGGGLCNEGGTLETHDTLADALRDISERVVVTKCVMEKEALESAKKEDGYPARLEDINELRRLTGASLSDCQKALKLTGDIPIAEEYIRLSGQAVARYRKVNGEKIPFSEKDYVELAKKSLLDKPLKPVHLPASLISYCPNNFCGHKLFNSDKKERCPECNQKLFW